MGEPQGETQENNAAADSSSWPYDPYWVEIDRPLEKLRLAAQAERTSQFNSLPNTPDRN
jgi:hypothetical protein